MPLMPISSSFFLITVIMVGFDPTMYTVSEGGVVSFTIRRMTPATRPFSVIFDTIPDSATGVSPHPPSHSLHLLDCAHFSFPPHSSFLFLTPFLHHSSFLFRNKPTSLNVALTYPPFPAAPDDYVAVLNQTVMFGPSDETQIVQVMVNNDSIAEEVEMFLGRLSLPVGSSGVNISNGDATAVISISGGE